jgi:hypothetical protein
MNGGIFGAEQLWLKLGIFGEERFVAVVSAVPEVGLIPKYSARVVSVQHP